MDLYKKYRPKTFSEIAGNENTISSLKSQLKSGFPDAILFRGPRGCGKTTLARIIKEELKCKDEDFMELNAANTRGIDTVRDVIESTGYSSFSGGVRIFLFDECHKLTADAQNALLKVLEDTPKNVFFILCTTEPEKVITTVRSRCMPFKVNLLPTLIMLGLLERVCKAEGKTVDRSILKEVAKVSKGSPREALVLLQKALGIPFEEALKDLEDLDLDESKTIDVIKLLLQPKATDKWEKMSKLIKTLEEVEPEQFRAGILNYLSKVLLGEEKVEGIYASRVSSIMELFNQPLLYGGAKGTLVLSLYKACNI